MPQHLGSIRRARLEKTRQFRNRGRRKKLADAVKAVTVATAETAVAELRKATAIIDRMATKHIIHKKKAANQKSKLARHIAKLAKKA